MTAEQGWQLVAAMGWNKNADYKKMAAFWWAQIGSAQMEKLSKFVDARVSDLYWAVDKYEAEHLPHLEVGSDDGFSDLRYHVVGLGQVEFEKALKNPKLLELRYRKNDYKESFAYVFQKPDPPRTVDQKAASIRLLKKNLDEMERQIRELEHQLSMTRGMMQDVLLLWGQVEGDLKNDKETA